MFFYTTEKTDSNLNFLKKAIFVSARYINIYACMVIKLKKEIRCGSNTFETQGKKNKIEKKN